MGIEIVMIVAWVVSVAFSVLIGAALITYVRRTWQVIRAEEEGSLQASIMDGLESVQLQMHALHERLEGLERRLPPPPPADSEEPPEQE